MSTKWLLVTSVCVFSALALLLRHDLVEMYYHREFQRVEIGSPYVDVAKRLGAGEEIVESKLPTSSRIDATTDAIVITPIVHGARYRKWSRRNFDIYISFDINDRVVQKAYIDTNSF